MSSVYRPSRLAAWAAACARSPRRATRAAETNNAIVAPAKSANRLQNAACRIASGLYASARSTLVITPKRYSGSQVQAPIDLLEPAEEEQQQGQVLVGLLEERVFLQRRLELADGVLGVFGQEPVGVGALRPGQGPPQRLSDQPHAFLGVDSAGEQDVAPPEQEDCLLLLRQVEGANKLQRVFHGLLAELMDV